VKQLTGSFMKYLPLFDLVAVPYVKSGMDVDHQHE
jgi:hypothetical protein